MNAASVLLGIIVPRRDSPMYLWGTYEAYPKGATLLKARKIGARIGRFLEIDELEAMTKGIPKADAPPHRGPRAA